MSKEALPIEIVSPPDNLYYLNYALTRNKNTPEAEGKKHSAKGNLNFYYALALIASHINLNCS